MLRTLRKIKIKRNLPQEVLGLVEKRWLQQNVKNVTYIYWLWGLGQVSYPCNASVSPYLNFGLFLLGCSEGGTRVWNSVWQIVNTVKMLGVCIALEADPEKEFNR